MDGDRSPGENSKGIEITLKSAKRKDKDNEKEAASQKAKQIQATRLARIRCHKIHTVALLASAAHRNAWINDPLLHARILSIVPMHLQQPLSSPPGKRAVPSQAQRGRMFQHAVEALVEWWTAYFAVDGVGVRRWSYEEVRRVLDAYPLKKPETQDNSLPPIDQPEIKLSRHVLSLLSTEPPLASESKSLQKHLLMQRGSRDVSALLFTALCRALGVPARLVVSLQSVGWWGDKPKPKKKGGKGKGKAEEPADEEEDDMEEVAIPKPLTPQRDVKGKGKAKDSFPGNGEMLDGGYIPADDSKGKGKGKAKPVIKLRKSKAGGRRLNESPPAPRRPSTGPYLSAHPDPLDTPPILWTEVFSRPDGVWMPVDPVRGTVNKRQQFDPEWEVQKRGGKRKEEANRMVYVVGFEEDGYAKDVTPRYAANFLSRVSLVQGAAATSELGASSSSAADRRKWWDRVLGMVKRPYVLNRDEIEDESFRELLRREGMPSSVAGFKGHELYVLERHLKQTETIYPLEEIGRFRGEPVYSRSNVVELKTAENWMRRGRAVKAGEQPLKTVKVKASTINRRRELEMFGGGDGRADTGKGRDGDAEDIENGLEIQLNGDLPGQRTREEEGLMQGLYAEFQTEVYKPPPVVNGKVPKNNFGNIDLYVPSMLPMGAVHAPFKGAAKVARTLGFDYAEAVTGFEFRKRRATPIITGVVVAAENEAALLEAYWEMERDAEEKRQAKRHEQVLKRWTRLIQGLRIRDRLKRQYTDAGQIASTSKRDDEGNEPEKVGQEEEREAFVEPGGYLTAVDDIVRPFALPRYQHVAFESAAPSRRSSPGPTNGAEEPSTSDHVTPLTMDSVDDDILDEEMEEVQVPQSVLSGIPKTMAELAEASARRTQINTVNADIAPQAIPIPSATTPSAQRRSGRTSRTNSTPGTLSSSTGGLNTTARNGRRKRTREDVSDSEEQAAKSAGESSPNKRAKTKKSIPVVSATPVRSDRVLRTRKTKTSTELEEERERELAYRRAVAE
ncbi:Rad4-domain-containing protein [Heliocybe sulcata]|uniref:Rad4-domain-containing protein n=1 Tax=Heliocybe sulcata TaxID=5364 RepID=A0A5C3NF31_9AGAM|nr:Rad4-domain-containing protein [Heliocybe sulcata]